MSKAQRPTTVWPIDILDIHLNRADGLTLLAPTQGLLTADDLLDATRVLPPASTFRGISISGGSTTTNRSPS